MCWSSLQVYQPTSFAELETASCEPFLSQFNQRPRVGCLVDANSAHFTYRSTSFSLWEARAGFSLSCQQLIDSEKICSHLSTRPRHSYNLKASFEPPQLDLDEMRPVACLATEGMQEVCEQRNVYSCTGRPAAQPETCQSSNQGLD